MVSHPFRHLPNRAGAEPTEHERAAYEAACAQLRSMPRPWPRFLGAPGVCVAVVEARGEEGQPCTGLAVEVAR